MGESVGRTMMRVRRETVEDTVKVPGFGFLDRELWAGLEPLRRVSFLFISIMFQYFPQRRSPSYGLLIFWMRFYLPPTIRQSWVMHLGDSVENIAAHFRLRRKEDALSSLLKAPYMLLGSAIFLFQLLSFCLPSSFSHFSFSSFAFFRLVFVLFN